MKQSIATRAEEIARPQTRQMKHEGYKGEGISEISDCCQAVICEYVGFRPDQAIWLINLITGSSA